jgi:hypothetical protein
MPTPLTADHRSAAWSQPSRAVQRLLPAADFAPVLHGCACHQCMHLASHVDRSVVCDQQSIRCPMIVITSRPVRLLRADAHHAGGRVFTHVDALGLEQRPHLLEGGDLRGAQQEAGSGCGGIATATSAAVRLAAGQVNINVHSSQGKRGCDAQCSAHTCWLTLCPPASEQGFRLSDIPHIARCNWHDQWHSRLRQRLVLRPKDTSALRLGRVQHQTLPCLQLGSSHVILSVRWT